MPRPYEHLKRAPITEALLDIRAVLPGSGGLLFLDAFRSRVQASFPTTRPIRQVQAEVKVDDDGAQVSQTDLSQHGEIHWNAEQTRAVQARRDGFTVNHVRLYENWAALRDQAREQWHFYVETAKPEAVQRCALRFINRIEIPAGASLKDVLLTRPEIGPSLPATDEFLMRLVLPFEDQRRALVTVFLEPASDPERRSLILDIEAVRASSIDPRSHALWDEFEALREIKNTCFFESLTEQVWRTFR